jgi:hypothetical protein
MRGTLLLPVIATPRSTVSATLRASHPFLEQFGPDHRPRSGSGKRRKPSPESAGADGRGRVTRPVLPPLAAATKCLTARGRSRR